MRLWSLHPKYLDTKGLVALWRESLLAKHVLEDRTKGYKNHPQLTRFKSAPSPLDAIHYYLGIVYEEACKRQYNFDCSKFKPDILPLRINVTRGQMDYELAHLKNKLTERDPLKWKEVNAIKKFEPHPLFNIVKGGIESWEIVDA